jgi:NAD dependent epimerase/dehydratase family enzyme
MNANARHSRSFRPSTSFRRILADAVPKLRWAGPFANELLLGGQRVLPNKALRNGFVFRHETLRSAFEAIL